jgi:hypothetical protein
MNEEKFAECSDSWLWSLMFDVRDKEANKEDVELAMEYYCHLFETRQQIPYYLLKLIDSIFRNYLERRHFNGALESAFGFKGKQGVRNIGQRNLDIATDVARFHLRGNTIKLSKSKVCDKYKLGTTAVTDAWGYYNMEGIFNVKRELQKAGKDFTKGQLKRALKIENQVNRKIQSFLNKTGT